MADTFKPKTSDAEITAINLDHPKEPVQRPPLRTTQMVDEFLEENADYTGKVVQEEAYQPVYFKTANFSNYLGPSNYIQDESAECDETKNRNLADNFLEENDEEEEP